MEPPRRFLLYRHRDPSSVSGTGVVAQGVEFASGWVSLHWPSAFPCTSVWRDLDDVLAVHGHQGAAEIRWIDPEPEQTEQTERPEPQPDHGADQPADWGRHDDPEWPMAPPPLPSP